ncbi:MotA/TolQ/ExbB proton channel family protein [Desulfobaculum bizertense]|uniref:Biopolymer transport protein ExbB n=1 Tax=Desulfobaculum bizertense DSM 18034 TaxID=1121442 RepID=A0A1T4VGZ5_9BACT|nr:MotA/TolQ/ExbB proton channel family protein [Desulfobaculum bizertense]SKA64205.1 biopolymer transport protein ExbB [Desulfobaculum bizertense DSM 18034]
MSCQKISRLSKLSVVVLWTLIFLLWSMSLGFCADAQDQNFTRAQKALRAQATESAQQTALGQQDIAAQKKALRADIAARRARVADLNARMKKLEKEFDGLLKKEDRLRDELAEQQDVMHAIEGTIRTSAKEADKLSQQNPISVEYPSRPVISSRLLDTDSFPGMQDIRELANLYFDEITATGEVKLRQGDFLDRNGRKATGTLLRVGRFSTSYLSDSDMGFLQPDAAGLQFSAVATEADRDAAAPMKNIQAGEIATVPVDLSGGAIFTRLAKNNDVRGWLESGGLLVWPIVLVGLAALILILERCVSLWRIHSANRSMEKELLPLLHNKDWSKCASFCETHQSSPSCRVLLGMLRVKHISREQLEDAMQEGLLHELPRLERFLPTLSVLAAIAPLLGLLGTVTGMIDTFQTITLFGAGNPRMMSGGISEALITTQLGLAVAIPIMVAHHLLERRVDALIGDMEEKGAGLALELTDTPQENTRG